MNVDDFLAEADDVIADWEGGPDSASWAADGSHEEVEIRGHYRDIPSAGMRGREFMVMIIDEAASLGVLANRFREASGGAQITGVVFDEFVYAAHVEQEIVCDSRSLPTGGA